MKFTQITAKVFAIALLFVMYGCTPDSVAPGSSVQTEGDTPLLFGSGHPHPVIEPACSPRVVYSLIDESGGMDVNYFGPFGNNTGTPVPWGAVTVVNSDSDLVMELDLAYGWYVEKAETFMGLGSGVGLQNGIPSVDTTWIRTDVSPLVNATEIWTPISDLPATCFDFCMRICVVRMDFFQGIDQASRTNLWIYNSEWNNPASPALNSPCFAMSSWCVATCPVLTRRGPASIQ